MNEPELTLQSAEESPEGRFNELLEELVAKGWPRRKAKRYLMAEADRRVKKFHAEGRKRQEKLRREGKLIDTSDIAKVLDEQFEADLAQHGLTKDDLDTMDHETVKDYVPPTNEF